MRIHVPIIDPRRYPQPQRVSVCKGPLYQKKWAPPPDTRSDCTCMAACLGIVSNVQCDDVRMCALTASYMYMAVASCSNTHWLPGAATAGELRAVRAS